MELRNINTFLHIAELHSFSSAARELGYSQSAVSAQIAQLEAELGTPLFDRVGKTVRLTDAGQTFQSYARTLLITAQQAKAALMPARAVSGTLRVALADSVCSTFLPDLLQQFHAHYTRFRMLDMRESGLFGQFYEEHREIVSLIRKGEAEELTRLIARHLEGPLDRMEAEKEKAGPPA